MGGWRGWEKGGPSLGTEKSLSRGEEVSGLREAEKEKYKEGWDETEGV